MTTLGLAQQWVPLASAVRPPILPVHLVTLDAGEGPAPGPPAPPTTGARPRPPQPIEAPRLVEAPPPAPVMSPPAPPAGTAAPAAAEPVPSLSASAPAASEPETTRPGSTGAGPSPTPGAPVASALAGPATTIPDGITQHARPRGGYQVRPSYPAAPRRLGIQGTTLLRVQILSDGSIGDVLVEQSAGHPDLDRAAADAVRAWRFEPARRGKDPVAMWVLLPVEFRLR